MDYKNDIDKELARRAYYNTSFSPERRGEQVREYYSENVNEAGLLIHGFKGCAKQEAIKAEMFEYMRNKIKALTKY